MSAQTVEVIIEELALERLATVSKRTPDEANKLAQTLGLTPLELLQRLSGVAPAASTPPPVSPQAALATPSVGRASDGQKFLKASDVTGTRGKKGLLYSLENVTKLLKAHPLDKAKPLSRQYFLDHTSAHLGEGISIPYLEVLFGNGSFSPHKTLVELVAAIEGAPISEDRLAIPGRKKKA